MSHGKEDLGTGIQEELHEPVSSHSSCRSGPTGATGAAGGEDPLPALGNCSSSHEAPDSTSSELSSQGKKTREQDENRAKTTPTPTSPSPPPLPPCKRLACQGLKAEDSQVGGDAEEGNKDFETELVLDTSPLQLDEKALLIHQVGNGHDHEEEEEEEEDAAASTSGVHRPRTPSRPQPTSPQAPLSPPPSEEEPILASNESSLVKQYPHHLLPPNVVVQNNHTETALILPSLSSVFSTGEESSGVVVAASKDESSACPPEVPIAFNPRNSSSPKGENNEEEVNGLILEAAPLVHHISSESNPEEDIPLSSREFTYILDASTACKFRKNEDPLTYINKDLFYGLSLEFRRSPESNIRHGSTVTSIILMDFREQKSREEALKTWSFWHSRQHNEDIRILDVEYNVVSGIVGHPTELAYNAVSVQWSPDLGNAYIMVAVRCLSTDFSIQKGIKGIPLQLQIDTSDEFGTLVSRAVCQVKVFCDKGAERKTREDLKRFVREIEKNSGPAEYCREGQPRSVFKPVGDLSSKPVLFTPYQRLITSGAASATPEDFTVADTMSPKRRCIRYREGGPDPARIMIYVRQDSDDIFTALHVHPPSVFGLIQAISAKYQIDFSNIRHLYRRDLRGIIVKVDDDMLKFYCDEDAFLMKVLAFEEKNTHSMVHDIVLVDLKTSLPDVRGGDSNSLDKDSNNNNNPENINENSNV